MDNLEEYIEKCSKAKEIQKLWKKEIGDICSVIWKKKNDGGLHRCILQREPTRGLEYNNNEWWYYNGKINEEHFRRRLLDKEYRKVIWLPTQEDLQNMINMDFDQCASSFWDFMSTGEWADVHCEVDKFKSWEQLWLCFVMKENYNKIWNGKDWIKEGK